ncbi:ATP-binding cassette domain-containing protein [Desulfosporosinus sp. OT]|uniref:energy-coupling factor ABC transporter ATP-binding protein n=1 Tax=Desulfosporosinus sp. OT TaxID=913865 RepID=UPI0002239EFB|nr:ATP-binding cassette domain-containing protein [Desulfosporosinus sp. OT]EGW36632.1 cobalt ABC transporter, ATP-binding family protein [Desulfosporosinus sp. OT]
MIILEARALTFAYPGRENVLREIDFTVEEGAFLALLGANGCGKTTLFQHFNGLLKPSAGTVLLRGKSLNEWGNEEIFRRVGLVFQDPNDQLFAATVYDDVSYGPTNLRLGPVKITLRVQQALKNVGMWEYRKRSLHELSYGQKKRVAIAGILAMQPEIMILDEPTAGLDPRTAAALMKLLKSLQKEQGLTIILATHDVDIVPIFCDRVYVMQNGAIIREGTPSQVFADPEKIRQAFLRLPRVAHLIELLKRDGVLNIDNLPLTIGEAKHCLEDLR